MCTIEDTSLLVGAGTHASVDVMATLRIRGVGTANMFRARVAFEEA